MVYANYVEDPRPSNCYTVILDPREFLNILYVMNIILGSAGILYGFAHAQRPPSLYSYHFKQLDAKQSGKNHSAEEERLVTSEESSNDV